MGHRIEYRRVTLHDHAVATAERLSAISSVWSEDALLAGRIDKADLLDAAKYLLKSAAFIEALERLALERGWR